MSDQKPKVTIVGAGPGDPELITLKGLKALQSADVVLYDALVNEQLLSYVDDQSHLIFVGKRSKKHHLRQEEINLLMVQSAMQYGHVVRLKGGDPFIFGRGYEELEFVRNFQIPVEIIPGVSSINGIPADLGIPLTKRGINESFWVVTATGSNGRLTNDLKLAIHSSATIVILMGIGKLREIVELFQQAGKDELPVMVVQNGTLPNAKMVIGTIRSILKEVQTNQIGTPGIIIAGNVISLSNSFLSASIEKLKRNS